MAETTEIKLYGDRICGGPPQLNLINYMAHSWLRLDEKSNIRDGAFIGFLPILGDWTNWGVVISDTPCCAVHLVRTVSGFFWGDDPRDTAENAEANPWVMMFYGNDNSSCFLRFPTREAALAKLGTMKGVDAQAEEMLYYNS